MSLTLVFGIGVFGVLLILLANSLEKKDEQVPLKIFIYFFVVISFVLLGKAGVDAQTTCEPVVNYTNSSAGGNQTNFYFTHYCYERAETTGGTFFKLAMWFVIIFYSYVFIVYIYKLFMMMQEWWGKR